jgi:hypothetical protein
MGNPRKLQKETHLDRPQQLHLFDPKPYEIKPTPEPTPIHKARTYFEPPTDIAVYAYHEGQIVILAQQTSNITDVPPRPLFIRHLRGFHPKWQAMRMATYIHEHMGYRRPEEIEV